VRAGTNTKGEIASHITTVFANMQRLLGLLRETGHIVVDEVAAPAWGYGGQTQEYRFIAGQTGAG